MVGAQQEGEKVQSLARMAEGLCGQHFSWSNFY
jgi:hypothetical protein